MATNLVYPIQLAQQMRQLSHEELKLLTCDDMTLKSILINLHRSCTNKLIMEFLTFEVADLSALNICF